MCNKSNNSGSISRLRKCTGTVDEIMDFTEGPSDDFGLDMENRDPNDLNSHLRVIA